LGFRKRRRKKSALFTNNYAGQIQNWTGYNHWWFYYWHPPPARVLALRVAWPEVWRSSAPTPSIEGTSPMVIFWHVGEVFYLQSPHSWQQPNKPSLSSHTYLPSPPLSNPIQLKPQLHLFSTHSLLVSTNTYPGCRLPLGSVSHLCSHKVNWHTSCTFVPLLL
jgi:hypothetical protein